jgi:hypothetical protein
MYTYTKSRPTDYYGSNGYLLIARCTNSSGLHNDPIIICSNHYFTRAALKAYFSRPPNGI